jgi:hypothetical protein
LSLFNYRSSRRQFLIQTSALSAAAVLPSALFVQSSSANSLSKALQIPSRDTQLKFFPDGTRRAFKGNTVICHLPVQSAMRDAMVEFHDELASSPLRPKLGLTSTDSYHMTIFPGANDQDRNISGWPSYVPPNATIEECSRIVGEKMAGAHLNCALPLRMKVDESLTVNHPTASTLLMVPVDDAENTKLRSLRDQLSDLYGFRLKNHDQYGFHITMSYQVHPFTDEEQTTYRTMLKLHTRRIIEAKPVLELGIPEYCTFPDMFRFEPQKLLVCS